MTISSPTAETFVWNRSHLIALEDLNAREIIAVLDTAKSLQEVSTRSIKKVPALRGKVVVNLFFEDSTRTRMSFRLAAQRMSADVLDFSVSTSSVSKGESLADTARNIEAMGVDAMVIRHRSSGAPLALSEQVHCSVINAGDGGHEHPTQGLLDLFTMRETFAPHGKDFPNLHVAIVGDVVHSRVARSNLWGLLKLGAKVTLVGPSTLCPDSLSSFGVNVTHDLNSILPEVDVINVLRVQFERLTSSAFPSIREYNRFFGIDSQRLKLCRPDVLLLHPGPMNRGLEISSDAADGPHSAILRQVSNGLAVRMAVLYLCIGANSLAAAKPPSK
ncbi:MAG TPA: aspartate carbamoyltransferase catalytic subunit [Phycisphaerae bacterium]|nr:aspartate carbamoyltransferase catalytic subunit [Phycisphaerae bacterium]